MDLLAVGEEGLSVLPLSPTAWVIYLRTMRPRPVPAVPAGIRPCRIVRRLNPVVSESRLYQCGMCWDLWHSS